MFGTRSVLEPSFEQGPMLPRSPIGPWDRPACAVAAGRRGPPLLPRSGPTRPKSAISETRPPEQRRAPAASWTSSLNRKRRARRPSRVVHGGRPRYPGRTSTSTQAYLAIVRNREARGSGLELSDSYSMVLTVPGFPFCAFPPGPRRVERFARALRDGRERRKKKKRESLTLSTCGRVSGGCGEEKQAGAPSPDRSPPSKGLLSGEGSHRNTSRPV